MARPTPRPIYRYVSSAIIDAECLLRHREKPKGCEFAKYSHGTNEFWLNTFMKINRLEIICLVFSFLDSSRTPHHENFYSTVAASVVVVQ